MKARHRQSLEERFDKYVYPDPNTGCFIWAGATTRAGYGQLGIGSRGDGVVSVHRYAWERVNGPIPTGLHVLHRCDMPCCVNPDHLFLGRASDNAIDRARKGRGSKSRQGLPYGVIVRKSGRFGAQVQIGGKRFNLGTYNTAEEAYHIAITTKHAILERVV